PAPISSRAARGSEAERLASRPREGGKALRYPRAQQSRLMRAGVGPRENKRMCRNIKMLFNFDPPATDEEIRAASLQFVRKLSGFNKPSKANQVVFNRAIEETARVARELIDSLQTEATPRNREEVAAKARARSAERFGRKTA